MGITLEHGGGFFSSLGFNFNSRDAFERLAVSTSVGYETPNLVWINWKRDHFISIHLFHIWVFMLVKLAFILLAKWQSISRYSTFEGLFMVSAQTIKA